MTFHDAHSAFNTGSTARGTYAEPSRLMSGKGADKQKRLSMILAVLLLSGAIFTPGNAYSQTVSLASAADADASVQRPDVTARVGIAKNDGQPPAFEVISESAAAMEPAAGPDTSFDVATASAPSGAALPDKLPVNPPVSESSPAADAALTPPPSLTAPSVPALAPASVPDATAVPHPDPSQLQAPAPVGAIPSNPPVANAGGPNSVPAKKESNEYYDSNATLPSAQMPAPGPRKVDPSVEPGQKLVVVEGVRKSTDRESVIASADRALKLGRYDAALELYNVAYAKNTRDKRILMGRAVAQQHLGQTDEAIATYEQLLDASPNDADALANMLGLVKQKDPAGALQRMLALQAKHPTHAGLAAQIGLAAGEAGNYDVAMRNLGKASILEPENPQHLFNMAVLADRQNKTAEAIRDYQQALQIDSTNKDPGQAIPHDKINDRLVILRSR